MPLARLYEVVDSFREELDREEIQLRVRERPEDRTVMIDVFDRRHSRMSSMVLSMNSVTGMRRNMLRLPIEKLIRGVYRDRELNRRQHFADTRAASAALRADIDHRILESLVRAANPPQIVPGSAVHNMMLYGNAFYRIPEDREEMDRVYREREAQNREADEKAYRLLAKNLTPEQLIQYDRTGCFRVKGQTPGLEFELSKKRVYNGVVFLHGKKIGKVCVSNSDVPICDMLLAQKLLIETNEKKFIETGNFTTEA